MARRNVFICDGADCGRVLVHPEDGFVVLGDIKTTSIDAEPKMLVQPKPAPGPDAPAETALCKWCMAKILGLPIPPEE
jgi:hypothetical protein